MALVLVSPPAQFSEGPYPSAAWALRSSSRLSALLPVIIIGGIVSGFFMPTESAAVACIYAFFVTMFIYRDYKWREVRSWSPASCAPLALS